MACSENTAMFHGAAAVTADTGIHLVFTLAALEGVLLALHDEVGHQSKKLTLVAILTCESGVVSSSTIPPGVAHIAIVRGDVGTVTVLCGELVMRQLTHVHVGVGCHDGGSRSSTGTRCCRHVAHNTYRATPSGAASGTTSAGTTTVWRRRGPGPGQFQFSVRFLYRTEDVCDGEGRRVWLMLMMLLGTQGHRQVSTIEFRKQAMEVRGGRASQGCSSSDFLLLLAQVGQQREARRDRDRHGRRRDHWKSQRAGGSPRRHALATLSTCLL